MTFSTTEDDAVRILLTGSRDWSDEGTIRRALLWAIGKYGAHNKLILVHGDCPDGADAIAQREWVRLSWDNDLHLLAPERHTVTKEDWARIGKRAGPERNQRMVNEGADICLAFPLPSSKGTFDCMYKAHKAGIPVKTWEPVVFIPTQSTSLSRSRAGERGKPAGQHRKAVSDVEQDRNTTEDRV
jgi:hypothetical protein